MEYTDTITGESLYEWDLNDRFNAWLDDNFAPVDILGLKYGVSSVLKGTDPTAYRCTFLDWIDAEEKSGALSEVTS